MNTEAAIYSLLSSNTAITNIVGNKIYPDTIPQGTTNPCITFSEISVIPNNTKTSTSKLDLCTVTINNYHNSQMLAKQLGQITRSILDGYKGTVANCNIQSITFNTSTSYYDYEAECYRCYSEYYVRQIL